MKSIEQNFVWTTLGVDLVALLTVGFSRSRWSIEFGFGFVVCFLIIGQLFIRYLAITNWYKTENSLASWALSILIFPASLALILSTSLNSVWFIMLGLLMLLASAKTRQTRNTVLAEPSSNTETAIRLQESMISESAFGLFMLFFAILARSGSGLSQLSSESTVFYGRLFALFHALVSTSKLIVALLRNKPKIQRYFEEP